MDFMLVQGKKLEIRYFYPEDIKRPYDITLVLLHEGLGCVALWRDFPQKLANASGCAVLAYSRAGYGQSDPIELPRPLDYMTKEAIETLPELLEKVKIGNFILIGHSDGATIASIFSGAIEDSRQKALCVMAPHFFTEAAGLQSIAEARDMFRSSDMKTRMAKYHKDPENAFLGWNEAWLAEGFKSWNVEQYIKPISVPILALQGKQDQYGSEAQIDAIFHRKEKTTTKIMLDDCKHSPHFEQPDKTLSAIINFVKKIPKNN